MTGCRRFALLLALACSAVPVLIFMLFQRYVAGPGAFLPTQESILVGSVLVAWGALGFALVATHRRVRLRLEGAEQALAASETRLRLAMHATGLGLWDYCPGQEAVGSNDEVALLLGYDPDAFSETRAAFVGRLHAEDRDRVRACFRDYLEGRRSDYVCEFRMRTRNGEYRWFRSVGQIVERDADANPSRVIGTYLDITEEIMAMRRLSELSARLLSVQEEERRRLARELHDEVGQQLTAVKLNLHAIGRDPTSVEVARRISDCNAIVDQTLAQVRSRVLDLRPPMLDDMGLGAALEWYCRRQEERASVCITLEGAESIDRFAEPVETAAFRLVQEAVSNALQHGGADEVSVSVRVERQALLIGIEDNGCGFEPAARTSGGVGLSAMEERIALAGGRFDLATGPGSGTRIYARLPLRPGEQT